MTVFRPGTGAAQGVLFIGRPGHLSHSLVKDRRSFTQTVVEPSNISTLRLTPFPCEMVDNDDGASSFTADQKFEMEMAKIHLEEVKAEAKVKVAEAMIAKFEERKASNTGFEYNTHSLTPRLYLTFCIKLDFFPLFCASSYTSQYFKIFGL